MNEPQPIPTELVAKFDKNMREQLRISVDTFKGKKLINMRVWFQHLDSGQWMPGKQGLTLPIEKYDALKTAVDLLGEKLKGTPSGESK